MKDQRRENNHLERSRDRGSRILLRRSHNKGSRISVSNDSKISGERRSLSSDKRVKETSIAATKRQLNRTKKVS